MHAPRTLEMFPVCNAVFPDMTALREHRASVHEAYEIEKVMKHRTTKEGNLEYRVRWYGFGSNDDTWEPEEVSRASSLLHARV